MRMSNPLLALVLTATLPVASLAAEQTKSQKNTAPVTVGDFAVMLVKVSAYGHAVETRNPAADLTKAGVPLGDPKAALNEERLAEILGHYGIKATTSSPQQPVSLGQAEKAAHLIGARLSASSGSTITPSGPLDDCLQLSNHGQCEGCCKDLGGDPNSCAKVCFEINKGSPGEPIP